MAEEVITPKTVLARSPPMVGTGKRVRSNSSPEIVGMEVVEGAGEGSSRQRSKKPKIYGIMDDVHAALDEIKTAVWREQGGKISFNRADQLAIRDAMDVIYWSLNTLTLENGKLRREVEVANIMKSRMDAEREEKEFTARPTYGEVTKSRGKQNGHIKGAWTSHGEAPSKEGRQEVQERDGGARPFRLPEIKTHETVVRREGCKDPEQVWRKVKGKLVAGATEEGIKAVRKLKNGGVIIHSVSESQKRSILETLSRESELAVRDNADKDPTIVMSGIDETIKAEDLKQTIVEQNRELIEKVGKQEFEKGFRVVTSRKIKDRRENSWICKARGSIYEEIMKTGYIVVDLVRTKVREYFDMPQCFKCCKYGHVAKFCREDPQCYKCGGTHEGKTCKRDTYKCVHCVERKLKEIEH